MTKILFIAGIVSYIIYRYLLKKQILNNAIIAAENLLNKIKNEGGVLNGISHYVFLSLNYETKVVLENAGMNEILNEIDYALAYLYYCSSCNQVIDIKHSESNHRDSTNTYLSNGRYTKDGDLDQRYNTKFSSETTYYFDAYCNQCEKKIKFKLSEYDNEKREELKCAINGIV